MYLFFNACDSNDITSKLKARVVPRALFLSTISTPYPVYQKRASFNVITITNSHSHCPNDK